MSAELSALRARWRGDPGAQKDGLEVGRALFVRVPTRSQPGWAAGVLRVLASAVPARSTAIRAVLAVAEDPSQWSRGHQVFDRVRGEVLILDRRPGHVVVGLLLPAWARRLGLSRWFGGEPGLHEWHMLLLLAELVCKVTYNATTPPDEFDEDSGDWIALLAKQLVDALGDPALEARVWEALTGVENEQGAAR